jgi:hypothetical protein
MLSVFALQFIKSENHRQQALCATMYRRKNLRGGYCGFAREGDSLMDQGCEAIQFTAIIKRGRKPFIQTVEPE